MEVAAGVFLGPIFEKLRDILVSLVVPNYSRPEEIDLNLELKKLQKMLPEIRAVLAAAEEKQMTDESVKSWMDDLTDLVYDLDDLLDDFATESLRIEAESEASSSTTPPSKMQKLISTCFTRFTTPSAAVKLDYNMMSKVKEINDRLKDIEARKNTLNLNVDVGGNRSNTVPGRRETTSLVVKSDVYGREEDKNAILYELLKAETSDDNKVSVIPIVGMGGIGKTTLARLVYDDDRLKGHFDLKAWVCVSDDYDAVRVTKTILEVVTSKSHELQALDMLQVKLKESLSGKRFLLVLDDIWNEKYADWELLRRPFMFGAPGSKIIVTTRLENVASTMSLSPSYPLKLLSKDECLSLFTHHALEKQNFDAHPNLKGIGEEIVSKCKGLPLTVLTLAGLLRTKKLQSEWENILNSRIWDLPEQRSGILPALKLSYHHLPSHLKQCFAYCAIFPKDYEFHIEELVLLWMGAGLLPLSTEKNQMEDFGKQYFDDLLSRSLFQQSSGSKSLFVMHDLLNDLALHVARNIFFRLDKFEGDEQFKIPNRARHLSYIRQKFEQLQKFRPLGEVQHLRTLLALPIQKHFAQDYYLANKILFDLLPKLRYLRVLSLSGYSITELPDSIGDLKHLRYLNLSRTSIKQLRESLSNLYNLETLLLRGCKKLSMLPPNIGNLINLRHLDIAGTVQLQEMSLEIGRLTNLQTLSKFIVGKQNMPGLKELMNVRLLRGSISIQELQNVRDENETNLWAGQDIEELELAWSSEFNDLRKEKLELDVLAKLKPHKHLKRLTIEFYGGTKFPSWIGDPSFSEIVKLTLGGCKKCISLPALGQLPKLKELHIRGMHGVQNLGVEFYRDDFCLGHPFPSLESLIFEDMPAWKEWSCSTGVEEATSQFPCLRVFTIRDCPKLIRVPLLRLPSLETLYLKECHEAVLKSIVDVQSLVGLQSLVIIGCNQLVFFAKTGVSPTLKSLTIRKCEALTSLPDGMCGLKSLVIEECSSLTSLPDGMCGLKHLEIDRCSSLTSWPTVGLPTALKVLTISDCMNLEYFRKVSEPTMMLQQKEKEDDFNNINVINMSSFMCLIIWKWPKVGMLLLPGVEGCVNNNNFASLRQLSIHDCDVLESLSFLERGLPNLRRLIIYNCVNLQSLAMTNQILQSPRIP
ncbi:putative disease resistance RPP13-like protein 1 [Cornus florida]|uniref:putative disease resistance RPP13-like protein 1 n=1 Tax=Cornus florida TaxID=4283 RepID=UPI0028A0539F|nr:putative disease resistance RPP13-like protein 1 [Cornus florida]XP_059639945.1 putative disease resistance RPP13-like protein 1 [Cornus florida]XP_059639946.1 putative disease resistance RPP13-like protein 1 [Cornus florida]